MARVRRSGSVAELAIRRRLWSMGLRFRVKTSLPGRPDLVFPRQKLAIFIDGDFWHGNAWRVRGLPSFESQFANRSEWWTAKIMRNMERDRQVTAQLRELGWRVERVWESDVLAAPDDVARRLAAIVQPNLIPPPTIPQNALERRRHHSVALKEHREPHKTECEDDADPSPAR